MRNSLVRVILVFAAAANAPAAVAASDGTSASACDRARIEAREAQDVFPATTDDFLDLADCLGSRDPAIRDGFAYETIAKSLRQRPPDSDGLRQLAARLTGNLAPGKPGDDGFLAPFSVLVLAEIARVDRINPFMSAEERSALARAGTEYLVNLRDYRGFDPKDGWRHGVAHAADLLMQLSLNARLTSDDARAIAAAIASQVSPETSHFYVFGEPGRLARPIMFLSSSGLLTEGEWREWFAALEASRGNPKWQSPYASTGGLARIHNTRQFASAIYVMASNSKDPASAIMAEASLGVLKSLP